MSITIKTSGKKGSITGEARLSEEVRSYENDPYFVNKGKKAEAFLKKVGLPKKKNNS
jgi:hypothetical protein